MTHNKSVETLADTTARLRAAFRMIPLEENALMNAVCAFVDEMRRFNWPIERMIIEVKRVAEVEDGQLFRALIGEHQSRVEAQRLISRLVSQCITHYYATSST